MIRKGSSRLGVASISGTGKVSEGVLVNARASELFAAYLDIASLIIDSYSDSFSNSNSTSHGLNNITSNIGADLGLDWQHRVLRKKVSVYTSMVVGSTWQAIRATSMIESSKEEIVELLMDDDRMYEFDDMVDYITVSVLRARARSI
jgi:hypothetical protein